MNCSKCCGLATHLVTLRHKPTNLLPVRSSYNLMLCEKCVDTAGVPGRLYAFEFWDRIVRADSVEPWVHIVVTEEGY